MSQSMEGNPEVIVCRGPDKGCAGSLDGCPECLRVEITPDMTAEQVEKLLARGDA